MAPRSAAGKRLLTSSAFFATFLAAIVTVSVSASSGALPCPARPGGSIAPLGMEGEDDAERAKSVGEKVKLTRKGGWIEIEPRKR